MHYGWDNDPELSRKGHLYFYNNTVSIREDRSDNWRFRLFDMRLYRESAPVVPSEEVVEAFNNIVYFNSETAGADPAYMCMSNNSGTVNLGVNWISSGWQRAEAVAECYPYAESGESPVVNGVTNLIDTTHTPVPINTTTLASKNLESIKNRSQDPLTATQSHPVTMQYIRHQQEESRTHARDLGAMQLLQTRQLMTPLQLFLLE